MTSETTTGCPYCKSQRYVNEDGGVICDRCGAEFLTEENTQDAATYLGPDLSDYNRHGPVAESKAWWDGYHAAIAERSL